MWRTVSDSPDASANRRPFGKATPRVAPGKRPATRNESSARWSEVRVASSAGALVVTGDGVGAAVTAGALVADWQEVIAVETIRTNRIGNRTRLVTHSSRVDRRRSYRTAKRPAEDCTGTERSG